MPRYKIAVFDAERIACIRAGTIGLGMDACVLCETVERARELFEQYAADDRAALAEDPDLFEGKIVISDKDMRVEYPHQGGTVCFVKDDENHKAIIDAAAVCYVYEESSGVKAYMVHCEHGCYSDWTYKVVGLFSSYERAASYLRNVSVDVGWDDGDDHCYVCEDWEVGNQACYENFGRTHGVRQKDGTWRLECDGMKCYRHFSEPTYHITEYVMDEPDDNAGVKWE